MFTLDSIKSKIAELGNNGWKYFKLFPFLSFSFKFFLILLFPLIIPFQCAIAESITVFENRESEEITETSPLIPNQRPLVGGWYYFEPFQYEIEKDGVKKMTGLDYELMKAFSRHIGIKIGYKHLLWQEVQNALQEGALDFGSGALFTKERAEYAYFSIPYRFAEASLFLPSSKLRGLAIRKHENLIDALQKSNYRLAVVEGFAYSDPTINAFVNDPSHQDKIIKTQSDHQSLDLMLSGEVDGFLADRIVGSTLIWHIHPRMHIVERRLDVNSPIHIMFSKNTVSKEIVELFDQGIREVMDSSEYRNIVSWYLYPAIVFQIRDAPWFRFTEIIGTIAFAISGLIIAYRDRATLFGALILAILPSLGGGLMRDVILDRTPVGAIQSPIYFIVVLVTVFTGFLIVKIMGFLKSRYKIPSDLENLFQRHIVIILTITDAIGLATFTVIGVMVSLLAKADPLWLWGPFFAFMTGAGGGILRDIVSKKRYIEALEGEFYGELAIFWGFALSLFLLLSARLAQPEHIQLAVIFTIIGVLVSRIIVHYWKLPNIRFMKSDK